MYALVHLTMHLTFKEHQMLHLTFPLNNLEDVLAWVSEFEQQYPDEPLWPELKKAKDEWERRSNAGPEKPTTPTKKN